MIKIKNKIFDETIQPFLEQQTDSEFANGAGYFQLTRHEYDDLIKELRSDLDILFPHLRDKDIYNIGRWVSDSGIGNVWRIYSYVIMQIDKETYRFYGQPYFKTHPSCCSPNENIRDFSR